MPLRVCVIDDDVVLQDTLAMLLRPLPDFVLAGQFGAVQEALDELRSPLPDIALVDVNLPGIRGSHGAGLLRGRFPAMQVIMLTVHAEEDVIFEAICNGAVGYLLKHTPPDRLLDAIRDIHLGGASMSPSIARRVIQGFRASRAPPHAARSPLTAQHLNLLRLLADGHSYESAGATLDISVNTVRKHIRDIYRRLHVHTSSEAVATAIRQGWI